ncbi:hypothetical protein ACIPSJ_27570 [Streptomyces sp. NPDC090088]|uniref:hypothetical protein n=1 Tax=Streptomyces sp. NPDC090088 TaxID=3365944 RepID=UPI003827D187
MPLSLFRNPAELLERKRVHGVFGEHIWYESVIAISRHDTLRVVELHWDGVRDADRGILRPAPPPRTGFSNGWQRLSKPFGTGITIKEGIGHLSF